MGKRYEVSEDGQSILDNRTHAAVPLPEGVIAELLMDRMVRSWALEDWAEDLNS